MTQAPGFSRALQEGTGGWQAACEVCGRCYPHEHVKAIYSSRAYDSSDGEDDGDGP